MTRSKKIAWAQIIVQVVMTITIVLLVIRILNTREYDSDGNEISNSGIFPNYLLSSLLAPLTIGGFALTIFGISIAQIIYGTNGCDGNTKGLVSGICGILGIWIASFVMSIIVVFSDDTYIANRDEIRSQPPKNW